MVEGGIRRAGNVVLTVSVNVSERVLNSSDARERMVKSES